MNIGFSPPDPFLDPFVVMAKEVSTLKPEFFDTLDKVLQDSGYFITAVLMTRPAADAAPACPHPIKIVSAWESEKQMDGKDVLFEIAEDVYYLE